MGCEMVLDTLEGTAMPQVWGNEAEQRRHTPESLVGTMASWQRKLSCISAGLMLELEDKHVNVSSLIDMWHRSCQFFFFRVGFKNGWVECYKSIKHSHIHMCDVNVLQWGKKISALNLITKNLLWIGCASFCMKEM